jgi:phenylacetate-CoA ligase
MMLRSLFLRNLVFPLASWRAENGFSKQYRFLRASQWWTREKLQAHQTQRLRALLEHAYEMVPFYREWLGDHGLRPSQFREREQLDLLPVLSKQILREQPCDRLISLGSHPEDRIPYSTSGSTGEPFRFLVSRWMNGSKIARYLREMQTWGIEPGTPFLKVWGAGRVPAPGREKERDLFARHLLRRAEELAFDLDPARADTLLRTLAQRRLRVLEAYTSTAVFLAKRAREQGMLFPHLKSVVVSGETLTPEHEQFLCEAFSAKVINAYGSREFGRVAFSCPEGGGLCLSMEDFYAEYLDLDPPDPEGLKRLVLTCFSNEVQPFIRYDTGDLVEPAGHQTHCGRRGLEVWKRVAGRLSERVTTPSGRHVSVHFFTLLLEDLQEEVRQFQVVVDRPDNLVLLIVPGSRYSDRIGTDLAGRISDQVGPEMGVTVRLVAAIPFSGDGKRPLLRQAF